MTTTCLNAQEKVYLITVLREEMRRVGEGLARYRFCTSRFVRPEYYVEIVLDGERAAARLGEDYPTAQILFDRLVCGTVTPCTLEDIIEDIKITQNPFTNIKRYVII